MSTKRPVKETALMIALVLQGVEGLVFNFPPGTAASHHIPDVFPGDG
jgi:hypothetical protein